RGAAPARLGGDRRAGARDAAARGGGGPAAGRPVAASGGHRVRPRAPPPVGRADGRTAPGQAGPRRRRTGAAHQAGEAPDALRPNRVKETPVSRFTSPSVWDTMSTGSALTGAAASVRAEERHASAAQAGRHGFGGGL